MRVYVTLFVAWIVFGSCSQPQEKPQPAEQEIKLKPGPCKYNTWELSEELLNEKFIERQKVLEKFKECPCQDAVDTLKLFVLYNYSYLNNRFLFYLKKLQSSDPAERELATQRVIRFGKPMIEHIKEHGKQYEEDLELRVRFKHIEEQVHKQEEEQEMTLEEARIEVAGALADMVPDPILEKLYIDILKDVDQKSVKVRILRIVEDVKKLKGVIAHLIKNHKDFKLSDSEWVRIVRYAESWGLKELCPHLLEIIEKYGKQVKIACIFPLTKFRYPAGIKKVVELLSSNEYEVRHFAFSNLRALAKDDFGYNPWSSPQQLKESIARFEEWRKKNYPVDSE